MVIKSQTGYWVVDTAFLSWQPGADRKIKGGPLIDLAALQDGIRQGLLVDESVWLATDRCERDLQNYRWGHADVLTMLDCLKPGPKGDYRKSEWCEVKGGRWVPCDVYRLNYDSERQCRNPNALEVYLKFSIEEDGALTLVMVSCHGSR